MKFILSGLLVVITLNINAQGYLFTNGKKSIQLNQNHFYDISISKGTTNEEIEAAYNFASGQILSVEKDSISFQISTLEKHIKQDGFENNNVSEWDSNQPINMIAKEDILFLSKYKSAKNKKIRDGLSITGGILIFTGLTTTLNATLVKKKGGRENVFYSGITQFGVGIILASFYRSKKYYMKTCSDPWRFE